MGHLWEISDFRMINPRCSAWEQKSRQGDQYGGYFDSLGKKLYEWFITSVTYTCYLSILSLGWYDSGKWVLW